MSRLIRFPDVQAKTGGLSRSTIWRLEHEGNFPKRRVVTSRIVVWDEDEIDAWVHSQNWGFGLVPGTRKKDIIASAKRINEISGVRK
jgi:predicted DNA-binding transcriptional regulator AlpA